MNWVGAWAQKYISSQDSVLDLGCGIMQATWDTATAGRICCSQILGVDIYRPYLDFLEARGIPTKHWDLRRLPLPFPDRSWDHVLMTDLLEHLPTLDHAHRLLQEGCRISRKTVIALSPLNWDPNLYHARHDPHPYQGLGINKYQAHQILISEKFLQDHGFKTERKIRRHGHSYILAVRKTRLKILHVWDVCGIAGCMAKYQRHLGHHVDVVTRLPSRYGMSDYYGDIRILRRVKRGQGLRFYREIAKMAKNYDIIHIHSLYYQPFFIPGQKKLIEFHGTDIRKRYADGSWNKIHGKGILLKHLILKVARMLTGIPVILSTPDLLDDHPGFLWMPNPIDGDLFRPQKKGRGDSIIRALYFKIYYEDPGRAVQLAAERGWDLTINDRSIRSPTSVPYIRMPGYLGQFDVLIDRYNIRSLSKTALEALALGLKVLDYKGDLIQGMPSVHDPQNVAMATIRLYYDIMVK